MKIAIIGAGIVGITSAYYLRKQGNEVEVFDRECAPAMACSRANGGQISSCNAETWHSWKNVANGLKWMMSKDAPLLIRPNLSPKKIMWLAAFLKNTISSSYKENTVRLIQLAQRSSALYEEMIEEENLQLDKSNAGILRVYTNEKSLQDAHASKKLFEDHGVEWAHMAPADIRSHDPAMRHFKSLKGGFLTPSDWTGDAHLFCSALRAVCESSGVIFKFNTEVFAVGGKQIKYFQGENQFTAHYDAVVLCNGHEISTWGMCHGDFLNVYPVKGYSVTFANAEAAPPTSLLDDDRKIVSSKLGNRFRVAGTAELNGNNLDIRQDRIAPLIEWTRENFPDVDTSDYSPWACLRPMSSDMLPFIKKSKSEGLWYHGGHGHLGWTLSAATSKRLAEIMHYA